MDNLNNTNNSLEKIDEFATTLGIKKEYQTIFELNEIKDNKKIMNLVKGDLNPKEPWFLIDENNRAKAVISIFTLDNLLKDLRQSYRENFELKLEKAIYKHMPIDFGDVWTVAMNEIKKNNKNFIYMDMDFDKVLDKIKKEYPNLFINIQDLVQKSERK